MTQRVPDFYEPPAVELWAAVGALMVGLALGYVALVGRKGARG